MPYWSRTTAAVSLLLPLLLGACGNGAGEAGGAGAETAGADPDTQVGVEPACQPSERMDVEGRSSPYDSAALTLDGGMAKVCYGRPSLRGRTMIGGEAVPYDTLWRTGANEPTTLHVNVPARIAGMGVEPGAYSLYTIPREGEEWTLIVNRSTSQWGHEASYTRQVRAEEVGRATVRAEPLDRSVEQLTIRPMDDGGGLLLEWQETRVHIPIVPE